MKRLLYITVLAMIGLFSSINVEAQTWEWKGETVSGTNPQFYIQNDLTLRFIQNNSIDLVENIGSACLFTLEGSKTYKLKNANGKYLTWTASAIGGGLKTNENSGSAMTFTKDEAKGCYRIYYDGLTNNPYLYLNSTSVSGTLTKGTNSSSSAQAYWRLISPAQKAVYDKFVALKTTLSGDKLSDSAVKTAIEGNTYNWNNLSDGENLVNAYIALYDRITGMGELVADGAIAKLKTLSTKNEIDGFDGELTAFVNAKQAIVDELNAMTDISEEMAEARDQAVAGVNAVPFDASKTLEENKVNLEAARKPVTDVLARSNMLSLDGFYVYPGETKTISVTLANTLPVQSLSFEMLLPEGLTVSNFQKTDREPENYSINETTNTTTGAHFILNVTTDSNESIAAGEGAIITFDVTATEDFEYENAQIVISDIKGANAEYTDMVKADSADGIYTNTANADVKNAIDAAVEEVTAAAGDDNAANVVTAKENGIAAIKAATTVDNVAAAKDAAINAIKAAKDENYATALAAAKTAAISEITTLAGEKPADNVANALRTGTDAINDATTLEGVATEKANALTAIQAVIDANAAAALAAAKKTAKEALDEELNSYEDYLDKDMVLDAYTTALEAVRAATTPDEAEAAQETGIAAIQKAVEDYQYIYEGYNVGDVNGDKTYDIMDYVVLAKKILTPNGLPSKGADASRDDKRLFTILDANEDGVINVADLAEIINKILLQANPNYKPAVTSLAKGALRNAGTVTTTLRGNDLLIGLNNNINVVAMQMDITVPGATVTAQQLFADRADAHTIMLGDFGNGTYRILVVGTQNKPFIGNDGNIVALSLSGLEGEVEISNIYVSDAAAVSYTLDKGGVATAIESAPSSADSSAIHNISGMRLSEPAKGIYIQNGKKFVK